MSRLSSDLVLVFAARISRLFAYGLLSVILVLYLAQLGFGEGRIGLLLSLSLAGDVAVSLSIAVWADRLGRRKMLLLGAVLMILTGAAFVLTQNYLLLAVVATVGVVSPSGNEIGPFLSIEQAGLTELLPDQRRTGVFAWYNLVGSFATALGALAGGWLAQILQWSGRPPLTAYRVVLLAYTTLGVLLAVVFLVLSPAVEARPAEAPRPGSRSLLGLHRSQGIVLKLSALFSLDAFAGGFVVQSLIAYWFHLRFGLDTALLGSIFFAANVLAGISALLAARIAARIGLIRTMVFTHIPSNLLLCLVPLMPTVGLAVAVLLLRFSISQMDVPTRQSYTMAVVAPDERSAASGVTTVARSVGASASPVLAGLLLASPVLLSAPFFLSGGLKILYDFLLYRSFRSVAPPEEKVHSC
ncbi:MAG TPA: MFS transporter [Candidatus Sulfotelmatobacter sp.]|nr:MFS transporter [Candidatus Sulfotelmatobacter sp.]